MKKNRTDEEVKQPKKMTSIGGQALMEGLMMIGPEKIAMAVRLSDGTIHVETQPLGKSSAAAKIPFIRGSVKIFRQMVTGTKYIMRSAQFFEEEIPEKKQPEVPGEILRDEAATDEETVCEGSVCEEEPALPTKESFGKVRGTGEKDKADAAESLSPDVKTDIKADVKSGAKPDRKPGKLEQLLTRSEDAMLYLSALFGILLSVSLFILLPNLITNLTVGRWIDQNASFGNNVIFALFEGFLRISIFIGYLALATKLKDIKRLWMYHGAEHKTIFCYESGLPLTVANVRGFSKHHPRCGTAFMFIVLLLSIVIFSFVPGINVFVDLLIRLACVPLLAGISYEIIHWSARRDNAFTKILAWPGMMLQRLTTKEPDDSMIEVAIEAMLPVVPAGERGDLW